MKTNKTLKRLLAMFMAVLMMATLCILPANAASSNTVSLKFTQVDSSKVSGNKQNASADKAANVEKTYADDEIVRVSIVLDKASTIDAGFATTGIASNKAAVSYRNSLKKDQTTVTNRINKALGEKIDVVWNLTLAANIISANVKYGQIKTIEKQKGISKVELETKYEPCVVKTEESNDPNMATSTEQIGSGMAWSAGYTGAGTMVAVIDTGIDTDHQSFSAAGYEYSLAQNAAANNMTVDEYKATLNLLNADKIAAVADQLNAAIDAEKVYVNSKIPYAYNYVDDDYDITHDNDSQGEHGSHVEGIAAANAYIQNADGSFSKALDSVKVQGVAPDAQIVTMKVFGKGGGAYDSDYMVAIEDAIVLGCASVNLSLGSAAPGFSRCRSYEDIMNSLAESDTVVTMSAGNNGTWVENAQPYGYLYDGDVSYHSGGSPGSFKNSLGVASVDNVGFTGPCLEFAGNKVFYTESSYTNAPISTIAGEHEYIFITGVGTDEDFAAIGEALNGKIALCSRGTTSFYEKAEAAVANGAIATVIYNNQAGTINMDLSSYTKTQPCVSITQADGAMIKANSTAVTDENGNVLYYTGTMTVGNTVEAAVFETETYTMSSFSSWGVPGSLQLKPEITAPGGNIYSVNGAIAGGQAYETMSGTSMAAPQVAGIAALAIQYIKETGLDKQTGLSARQLANSLLMSTSVPMMEDQEGALGYYSVLTQGSGLANIGAAISADSYILMKSNLSGTAADGKVKAEVGDTADGKFTYTFTINNITDTENAYTIRSDFFTQDIFSYGGHIILDTWTAPIAVNAVYTVDGVEYVPTATVSCDLNGDGVTDAADAQIIIEAVANGEAIDADVDGDGKVTTRDAYEILKSLVINTVTVPANGSVEVTVNAELSAYTKVFLNYYYENGAYIEGYTYVEPYSTEEGVIASTHSIPVLGFYGNWSNPSMFDKITYLEYLTGQYNTPYLGKVTNYLTVNYSGDTTAYIQGGNPYLDEDFNADREAMSTNTTINAYRYSLIRNAGAVAAYVKNSEGKVVYLSPVSQQVIGAYYYTNGSAWQSTQSNFNVRKLLGSLDVQENEKIEIGLVAVPEYYETNGAITAEQLVALMEGNVLGHGAYLSNTVTVDSTAPQILAINKNLMNGNVTVKTTDNQYVAAVEIIDANTDEVVAAGIPAQTAAGQTSEITFEIDGDYSVLTVVVADYAGNETVYNAVYGGGEVSTEVESVTLSANTLSLYKGTSAALTATVLPKTAADASLTWTTSNADVATVSNGVVNAVGAGEAVITATSNANPEISATCAVTVKTIDVTIAGALQDNDGTPTIFTWDLANDAKWTGFAEMKTDISSVAWDWSDAEKPLYVQNTDAGMTKVDIKDGSTLESVGENAFGAPMWDMDFMFYTNSAYGTAYTFGTYSNPGSWAYLLYSEEGPMANTFNMGWNLASFLTKYSGGTKFVAITWGGIDYNDDDNHKEDTIWALDDAGYLWIVQPTTDAETGELTGNASFSYIPTTLDLEWPDYDGNQYCSMVFDDDLENLYLSYFTGETNEIYVLEYSSEAKAFVGSLLGDVGENVWPAAIFMASPNASEGQSTDKAAANVAATAVADVAAVAVDLSADIKSGSLNATKLSTSAKNRPTASAQGTTTEVNDNTVTVTISEDEAVNNGKYVVKYDPSVLKFENAVSGGADVFAYSVDEANGTVTVAMASYEGITAVATLNFSYTSDYINTTVTVDTVERNENVAVAESTEAAVEYEVGDHAWTLTETTPATKDNEGLKTYTCDKCGETKTETIAKVAEVSISATTLVYNGKTQQPAVVAKDADGNDVTFDAVYADGCKNVGKYTVTVTLNGDYAGTETFTFSILPQAPTGLKASNQTKKTITLSWKKVNGAAKYVVYKTIGGKNWVKCGETTDTTLKFSVKESGTKYTLKVVAVDATGKLKSAASEYCVTSSKCATPSITVTSTAKKTAKVSWAKVVGADSYTVYYSTSKDGTYKKLATVKGTSYTNKKLTSGKTYYFKVVANRTFEGKAFNSALSTAKKVKVK